MSDNMVRASDVEKIHKEIEKEKTMGEWKKRIEEARYHTYTGTNSNVIEVNEVDKIEEEMWSEMPRKDNYTMRLLVDYLAAVDAWETKWRGTE